MIRSPLSYLLLGAAMVALSGCTDFRRALGFEKTTPDEFAVTSAGPLTLPPDYGLRPPHTGSSKPATMSPEQQARVAVFKLNDTSAASNPAVADMSAGEQALVAKAGGIPGDSRIRQQVDAEVQNQADASDSFVDSLLFWQDHTPPDQSVDANAEAKRLRDAQDGPNGPTVERTQRVVIQGAS